MMSEYVLPAFLILGTGASVGYFLNHKDTSSIITETSDKIQVFTKSRRRKLAFSIGLICLIITLLSFIIFIYGNQQHDGWANLIMSSASYITTSFALITALLFLDFS
jgi:hypothetical protein